MRTFIKRSPFRLEIKKTQLRCGIMRQRTCNNKRLKEDGMSKQNPQIKRFWIIFLNKKQFKHFLRNRKTRAVAVMLKNVLFWALQQTGQLYITHSPYNQTYVFKKKIAEIFLNHVVPFSAYGRFLWLYKSTLTRTVTVCRVLAMVVSLVTDHSRSTI